MTENFENFKNRFKSHFNVYGLNLALFTSFFSKNREFSIDFADDHISSRKSGFSRPRRSYTVKISNFVQKHDFSTFFGFDDFSFFEKFFWCMNISGLVFDTILTNLTLYSLKNERF